MKKQVKMQSRFLNNLLSDKRGNTFAIAAAAFFPLAALVGGGVDISRLYLAKTRLQQACDAGALAGRRSMSGLTWTDANEETATNFFNTNFPTGKFGAGEIDIEYTASNSGAVTGVASVQMPMTLMALFDFGDQTVSADCTADLQLPNTDVMFVLDTTLSMNDTNPGDTSSRISVLRTSVKSFYDTLQSVKPAGATIRYGFVPYSSTVNVGYLLQRDWIQDNAVYDSRVPDGTSTVAGSTQGATQTRPVTTTTSGSSATGTRYQGSSERCVPPANSLSDTYTPWSAWTPSATNLPRSRTRTRTRNGTTYSAGLINGVCWITPTNFNNLVQEITETVSVNPNAGNTGADQTIYHWFYQPVSYSMTALKGAGAGDQPVSFGSFVAQVGNNHTNRTISWTKANGCIEERATRRTDEGANVPRHDMDIDLVPNPADPTTQWKPYLPGVVYGRNQSNVTATTGWLFSGAAATSTRVVNVNSNINYYTPFGDTTQYGACPTYALKMAEIDSATLEAYLAALNPAGFTYHDIGMTWGLRLMSPQGLFAAEHQAAAANGTFARHLIFMTDGETDTRIGGYDAWGMSAVARRRTPTGSIPTNATQNTLTETRLGELCTFAKNDKNITVWVIAFGTTLTPLLENCASPNRAYQADNAEELTETFAQIASQIAQLRLIS
ncbi:MAG: pilus assembly protein TadG-related protein [Pseudomonadota bacterium]